jgi:formylglycine-generating enzyme required for sulfatase activity
MSGESKDRVRVERWLPRVAEDRAAISQIEALVDPKRIATVAPDTLGEFLDSRVIPLAKSVRTDFLAETLFGICLGHPNALVRSRFVDVIRRWLPSPVAQDVVEKLIYDYDDMVRFPAIRIAGEERLEYSLHTLAMIALWPSQSIHSPGKPVGIGAATVRAALTGILGTSDPTEVEILRQYFEVHGKLPDVLEPPAAIPPDALAEFKALEIPGMVYIPPGHFEYGLDWAQVPDRSLGWTDAIPARRVWLPPFYIAKYPLTNFQYDEFCEAVAREGHVWCHPQEKPGKVHTRNTVWDSRFKPDHPATGIDWFDAFACCRWLGYDLPNEFQWEKAARGPSGTVWPWGDRWNPEACNWAGRAFDREFQSLDQWRDALTSFNERCPRATTTPVHEFEKFASGYGVCDMVGNCWEWTKTLSATGRAYTPALALRLKPKETVPVTIRGGAWTSLPSMMWPSFRSRDSPFDRHNEIGFRPVKNLPFDVLQGAGVGKLRHSAVY